MTQDISQRAQQILSAVVAGYIRTAEPVGSRAISRLPQINISAATIRNVMADLEDMGLLQQPHTSSGRVPTHDGLRFYVDSLLEVRELDQQVKVHLKKALWESSSREQVELLKIAGRTLSQVSQQVAVVAAPSPETDVFKHMEFVHLQPGLILVIFVSRAGAVQNRIIEADATFTQDDLDKFTRYLNDLLADLTLTEVRQRVALEMAREKNRLDQLLSRALRLGQRALAGETDGDLIIAGQSNLIQAPEFADISLLRHIFEAFEEKSILLKLLEKAMLAQGVQIFIGSESEALGLEGLTAITASYGGESTPLGALGIIGPTRMDYSKVIPIVDYTARLVSQVFNPRD